MVVIIVGMDVVAIVVTVVIVFPIVIIVVIVVFLFLNRVCRCGEILLFPFPRTLF